MLAAHEALERYVAACCAVTGILQMLALAEPADGPVAWSRFSRTPRPAAVSVRSVREFLRDGVSSFVHGASGSPTVDFIRARLAGPGGYAPDRRRKGRKVD